MPSHKLLNCCNFSGGASFMISSHEILLLLIYRDEFYKCLHINIVLYIKIYKIEKSQINWMLNNADVNKNHYIAIWLNTLQPLKHKFQNNIYDLEKRLLT